MAIIHIVLNIAILWGIILVPEIFNVSIINCMYIGLILALVIMLDAKMRVNTKIVNILFFLELIIFMILVFANLILG